VWTLRGHQGRMISESLTSWVIVGPKFTTTARAIYGETMWNFVQNQRSKRNPFGAASYTISFDRM